MTIAKKQKVKRACSDKRSLAASIHDDIADEKGAVAQYTRHINNPKTSPGHRKILRHIRGEEQMHIKELSGLLKSGDI